MVEKQLNFEGMEPYIENTEMRNSAHDFLKRHCHQNEILVPVQGDEEAFRIGTINSDGTLIAVSLGKIFDGRRLAFEAIAEKNKSQDEFYAKNPNLQGERAYIEWMNSVSDY